MPIRFTACKSAELKLIPLGNITTLTRLDSAHCAKLVSATHTLKGGHRPFDILHVAHARPVFPKRFLRFDANQLRLAKSVGL